MIQIIQLIHSSQSGQIFAWVVVDGIMLKIPVSVPRVFYLNSRSPVTEEFLGKCVNKTLPHGRRSYNLYEVLVVFLNFLFIDFLVVPFFPPSFEGINIALEIL